MYAVMQMGMIGEERYETREDAQEDADSANAEMLEACGQDVGDGAATVVEIETADEPALACRHYDPGAPHERMTR